MLDKKYRKKNGKAYRTIYFNFFKMIVAVVAFLLGLVYLFAGPVLGLIFIALGVLEVVRYNKVLALCDLLRDYGPLMVNHPEYSIDDLAKGVHRDRDTVISEIQLMLKKKVLFGEITTSDSKFILDDDFNLRILMQQNGWANALFV